MVKKKMGSAVILAGGENKRFGSPKAFIEIDGKTIIEIIVNKIQNSFKEIIVVTDQDIKTGNMPVTVTGDIITNGQKSSLRGLHTGLKKSAYSDIFVIGCDMPFINVELVEYLHSFLPGNHAVVPMIDGYAQPLFALYDKSCLPVIEESLKKEKLKISCLYKNLKIAYIFKEKIEEIDPGQKSFYNINTVEDFNKIKELFYTGLSHS